MSMFVSSDSFVDKEALQEYILKRLKELELLAESIMADKFWQKFHETVIKVHPEKERLLLLKVESQLKNLPLYIGTWIKTAVDTKERFDFFISAKAKELGSGDEKKDYFWALQIRHDQLVALVRVLTILVDHLDTIKKKSPSMAINDEILQGLAEYSIEDQIYLEAEKVHIQRQKLTE